MITRIISGGQTGADLGGVMAAYVCGIKTGGWVPHGYRNERWRLDAPLMRLFGMHQTDSTDYKVRTERNIRGSEATIIVAQNFESRGTKLTVEICKRLGRPYFLFSCNSTLHENVMRLRENMQTYGTINVAGNRESVAPGIEDYTFLLFHLALTGGRVQ